MSTFDGLFIVDLLPDLWSVLCAATAVVERTAMFVYTHLMLPTLISNLKLELYCMLFKKNCTESLVNTYSIPLTTIKGMAFEYTVVILAKHDPPQH